MFHVGQLVVCVDAGDHSLYAPQGYNCASGPGVLAKGRVYTIRAAFSAKGVRCVLLNEIVRAKHPYWKGEPPYAAARFRPVQDSALDIFRSVLADVPKRATETA